MGSKEIQDLKDFRSLVEDGSFVILLNMNDTFAWATADAERMPTEDIKHVLPLYQKYGDDALNAYAAVKRNCDVMDHPKLRTDKYYAAKEALLVFKKTIDGFMEE